MERNRGKNSLLVYLAYIYFRREESSERRWLVAGRIRFNSIRFINFFHPHIFISYMLYEVVSKICGISNPYFTVLLGIMFFCFSDKKGEMYAHRWLKCFFKNYRQTHEMDYMLFANSISLLSNDTQKHAENNDFKRRLNTIYKIC